MRLYLASANPGKLREYRDGAHAHRIVVKLLPGYEDFPLCSEDGKTFEENARKKALHYSRHARRMVFADDSGISVEALGGAPGVISARFAGTRASDEENNQKLVAEIRRAGSVGGGLKPAPTNRRARYICVIALAKNSRLLAVVEGWANGLILEAPRGKGGFGYDPLFFYPPLGKTFAELSPEQKFAVSHRGKAFRKLLDFLKAL